MFLQVGQIPQRFRQFYAVCQRISFPFISCLLQKGVLILSMTFVAGRSTISYNRLNKPEFRIKLVGEEETYMSKFKAYLITGCILMMVAILFILYAVNNPQASFPWSNSVTYIIYILYGLLTGCVWGLVFKHRPKQTK